MAMLPFLLMGALGKLVLELKADNLTQGVLKSWSDTSGFTRDIVTKGIVGTPQVMGDSSISKNFVRFDGSSYAWSEQGTGIVGTFTLVAVLRLRGPQTCCKGVFALIPAIGQDSGAKDGFAVDMSLRYRSGFQPGLVSLNSTALRAVGNNWFVLFITVKNSKKNVWEVGSSVDGKPLAWRSSYGSSFTANNNGFIIANRWPQSRKANLKGSFDVAAFRLYDTSIEDTERKSILSDLKKRYGLANVALVSRNKKGQTQTESGSQSESESEMDAQASILSESLTLELNVDHQSEQQQQEEQQQDHNELSIDQPQQQQQQQQQRQHHSKPQTEAQRSAQKSVGKMTRTKARKGKKSLTQTHTQTQTETQTQTQSASAAAAKAVEQAEALAKTQAELTLKLKDTISPTPSPTSTGQGQSQPPTQSPTVQGGGSGSNSTSGAPPGVNISFVLGQPLNSFSSSTFAKALSDLFHVDPSTITVGQPTAGLRVWAIIPGVNQNTIQAMAAKGKFSLALFHIQSMSINGTQIRMMFRPVLDGPSSPMGSVEAIGVPNFNYAGHDVVGVMTVPGPIEPPHTHMMVYGHPHGDDDDHFHVHTELFHPELHSAGVMHMHVSDVHGPYPADGLFPAALADGAGSFLRPEPHVDAVVSHWHAAPGALQPVHVVGYGGFLQGRSKKRSTGRPAERPAEQ